MWVKHPGQPAPMLVDDATLPYWRGLGFVEWEPDGAAGGLDDAGLAALVRDDASATAGALRAASVAAVEESGIFVPLHISRSSDRPRRSIARAVMASPPVIGAERTVSGITNGKKWSPLTGGGGTSATVDPAAPFLYVGGFAPKLRKYSGSPPGSSTGFPNYNYVYSTHLTTPNTANPVQAIAFGFDGTECEINLRTVGGQAYRLMVDGEYVTTASTPLITVGQVWLPLSFPTRKPRVITVETYNCPWGGVVTGPNDTVWKPQPSGPRVVIIGDSYTAGVGADAYLSGYVATARDMMGWRNVVFSGSGGTGYLAAQTAGTVKFRDRVQNDVIDLAPDIVVVAGGHNDYPGFTEAQIKTEAQALFQTIKTGLPRARLFVVGVYAQGASAAEYATVEQWIKAAADASGVVDGFVPAASWFTGTGRVGATTGTGNSDLYISSDGVHPNQAGHDYLGHRLAEALSALLPD